MPKHLVELVLSKVDCVLFRAKCFHRTVYLEPNGIALLLVEMLIPLKALFSFSDISFAMAPAVFLALRLLSVMMANVDICRPEEVTYRNIYRKATK